MFRKSLLILSLLGISLGTALSEPATPPNVPAINRLEPFKKNDRVLILAPHPDDEAIGCAGVIQQALSAGAQVKIAYLTNGDHNQIAFLVYEKWPVLTKGEFIHMGEIRRSESIKAMKLLGLDEKDLIFLGYPDFGTFTIFTRFWQTKKPFKSFLTRISSVPYKENFSFREPYVGESILSDIEKMLLAYRPNKIFVSHPADVNVDHKSLYLFLQVALGDLEKSIPSPKVYPYLIHCVGWPLPRHYHPQLELEPPEKFLDGQISWVDFALTPGQLNKKYQAILCYKSQTSSSAFYLLSFARKNELFGDYQKVELSRQAPLKEKELSFFGFSNMFFNSNAEESRDLEEAEEVKQLISYAASDGYFLIRINNARTLSRKLSFMLYLIGYDAKTPFSSMPKIQIIVKNKRIKVLDKGKVIRPEGLSLDLDQDVLTLKVPLAVLGEPAFVLTSLKAYGGFFPVAVSGFRKIEIR